MTHKGWHVIKPQLNQSVHLVEFLPFFHKKDNFCDFLFSSLHTSSLQKRHPLKQKKNNWEKNFLKAGKNKLMEFYQIPIILSAL